MEEEYKWRKGRWRSRRKRGVEGGQEEECRRSTGRRSWTGERRRGGGGREAWVVERRRSSTKIRLGEVEELE